MRSWTQRNLLICLGAACLLLVGESAAQQASPSADGQAPASAMVAATVPRLIRFSGVAKNAQGQPRSGVVGITFALYKEQEGGAALWLETQTVVAEKGGRGFSPGTGAQRDRYNAAGHRKHGSPLQRPHNSHLFTPG